MTDPIHFEDLRVGQRFQSRPVAISEEEIIRFARDNDPQYFHVDPEAARKSLFGGLVASGWQTGALTLRLLLSDCGLDFFSGAVGVDARIAWRRPVRPGDELHIAGEITNLKDSGSQPEHGIRDLQRDDLQPDGRGGPDD